MDPICEELMLESVKEFDEIDDEIYSESVFYLVDEYIDECVNKSMNNIFSSDSDNTVYMALADLINLPIKSDERDCENDSDFTYVDWAPEDYNDGCTEEDLRDVFYPMKTLELHNSDDPNTEEEWEFNNNYDSLFGDNQ